MLIRLKSECPAMRAISCNSSTTTGSAINALEPGIVLAMSLAIKAPRLLACSPFILLLKCSIINSLTSYIPDGIGFNKPPLPMITLI